MNVKMFGEICDAFGPSGFEEDVIRTVAKYCKGLELENDAMNNLYARMPGEDPEKPVVMLDAIRMSVDLWYRASEKTEAWRSSCSVE